jgi:hypothetical protein
MVWISERQETACSRSKELGGLDRLIGAFISNRLWRNVIVLGPAIQTRLVCTTSSSWVGETSSGSYSESLKKRVEGGFRLIMRHIIVTVNDEFGERCLSDM